MGSGSGDLAVDDRLLVKTAKTLSKIQYEFEHTEDHQGDLRKIWGSGDVAGAMDHFADNWSYHRKQLLSSVRTVGELAEKCHEAFRELDQKLAKTAQGPKGGK
ncbi:hypothetical protein ACWGJB_32895 [Streptomyces sp. NPDC054813]